jgi:hypothetical protein
LNLPFALDDETYSHALHPPRAQTPAAQLFAQQRAELVAYQPVEDAPRLLRIHAVHVHRARIRKGVVHRVARDFVELDALYGPTGHLSRERLLQMPRNGFAFTVGVGGEEKLGGSFGILRSALTDLFLEDDIAGEKSWSTSRPCGWQANRGCGRSNLTVKPRPRNLATVRALAGDSTITSLGPFRVFVGASIVGAFN